jgi:NitT/TauT family transport system substrate-binding protein
MKRNVPALLLAAVLCTFGSLHAAAQDTLKVAVPQRGAWDTSVTELGVRSGIFKKHGLDVQILYTQGGAESIQSIIGGSMDVATAVGVASAISAFAKGAPIRVIGSEMIGSPDLYWYVLPNSPVKKIEDFNDKTIGYSVSGSSSHAALLELIQQYKLRAKPLALGGMQTTLTQTMTGQVDIGWSGAPFGLDVIEQGRARIVARGSDVTSIAGRTTRVNLANLQTLQNRKSAVERFMQGYREVVEWMYSDPAALKTYGEFSGLPDSIVQRVREFIPKETMAPDRIVGMDQVIADAIKLKFINEALTAEQAKELIRIPGPLK